MVLGFWLEIAQICGEFLTRSKTQRSVARRELRGFSFQFVNGPNILDNRLKPEVVPLVRGLESLGLPRSVSTGSGVKLLLHHFYFFY